METSFFFSFALMLLILNTFILSSSAALFDFTTYRDSLLTFKYSISDPMSVLSGNWSSNTSICYWTGISCGLKHHRVTALNLSGLALRGNLAPHLGNLTFLRSLDISSNYFNGSIPLELSNLRRLKDINVGFNNLSGEIPSWFGALSHLQHIYLNNNSFSRRIPLSLFNISRLQTLDMSYNLLDGEIPNQICDFFASLETLNLAGNELTGSIPSGIFTNMSVLVEIDLRYNYLSGQLQDDTCRNMPKLKRFFLEENQFYGNIPRSIYQCREMEDLRLSFNQFNGNIPTEIGNLTMLRILSIYSNHLQGKIPSSIFNISSLEIMDLSNNTLSGTIPTNLNNLRNLKLLYLSSNNLTGGIPKEIGYLTSLNYLYLYGNNLTDIFKFLERHPHDEINETGDGRMHLTHLPNTGGAGSCFQLVILFHNLGDIPKQVGNLTSLVELDLAFNKLKGELPERLGNLAYLEDLSAPFNDFLSGSIPSSIFNLSTLKTLSLQQNQFSGTLPSTMGNSLVNLEELYLFYNKLSGEIPTSITNASLLTVIELNRNSFTGFIPDFGNLRLLQTLRLWENNLTGAESPNQELTFLSSLTNCRNLTYLEISDNPEMNGILPASIGNLSTSLITFSASNCSIRGVIPSEIGNLSSLQTLDLSGNQLTGFIPTTMGKLKQLQRLHLYNNQLQGSIPHHLCNISNLGYLYIGGNMLTGVVPNCLGGVKSLRTISFASNKLNSTLPSEFFNLKDIINLDLSSNYLSGQLPSQIGSLTVINYLDLSSNNFLGNIPTTIENCNSLVSLYLSNNMFNGSIPQSLGEVLGLSDLDLSNNDLTGVIPESLEKLRLEHFNVSHNKLQGKIPEGGSFGNFTAESFAQNVDLCGAARFGVPPCKEKHGRSRSRRRVVLIMKYIVPPFIAVVILVIVILFLIMRSKKKRIPPSADISSVGVSWKIITERELTQGTSSFSEINLLGKGSFGSVFKAILANETVAVKVFNLELEGALKSFDTESRILSAVRHRNLLRILGCCSNTQFKALILAYMPNGSLEKWLHSDSYVLDLMQRLNIAIDVALALEYLHHDHGYTVVHCDIKPNNVLLDADMTAHVADFGISKLFEGREAVIHTITMATIGYAAPEYGLEGKVSTKGDVYSYGILLLEIFTSKKPTDDMFSAEMGIKEWVEMALHENGISEVVAPGLLSREDRHFSAKEQCVSSIFDLAMKCLVFSAEERINMMQVVAALHKFKLTVEAAMKTRQSRSPRDSSLLQ